MLWTAATRTVFTVCRADGQVIWREPFGAVLPSAAASSEAAAQQAIWLGGCLRHEWGADAATLHLVLDTSRGVAIDSLERHAFAVGLALDLSTESVHNPAVEQRKINKYVDWRRIDLGALIQASADPRFAHQESQI